MMNHEYKVIRMTYKDYIPPKQRDKKLKNTAIYKSHLSADEMIEELAKSLAEMSIATQGMMDHIEPGVQVRALVALNNALELRMKENG